MIICEKHIVFVNPILVGYGKLLQCNDNISHWLHGRERSRSQCSPQCSLEDAYLQRPACHIFGFAIYFGVPLHCTTFWISTWATRHVSFKEESRMIGQSLRWEVFNNDCNNDDDDDSNSINNNIINLDKSVVMVALASAQCSFVRAINPLRVDSRNTCCE